jgi:Flp pilus assembly protein TadD
VHFVQLQLARFHRNRAELEEAIAAYRRAARSPGATADTWSELAVALEARGDVEGAIAALRRGFQLDSADLALVKHLAGLLKSEAR